MCLRKLKEALAHEFSSDVFFYERSSCSGPVLCCPACTLVLEATARGAAVLSFDSNSVRSDSLGAGYPRPNCGLQVPADYRPVIKGTPIVWDHPGVLERKYSDICIGKTLTHNGGRELGAYQ